MRLISSEARQRTESTGFRTGATEMLLLEPGALGPAHRPGPPLRGARRDLRPRGRHPARGRQAHRRPRHRRARRGSGCLGLERGQYPVLLPGTAVTLSNAGAPNDTLVVIVVSFIVAVPLIGPAFILLYSLQSRRLLGRRRGSDTRRREPVTRAAGLTHLARSRRLRARSARRVTSAIAA